MTGRQVASCRDSKHSELKAGPLQWKLPEELANKASFPTSELGLDGIIRHR